MSSELNYFLIVDPQNSFCAKVPAKKQQLLHNGELGVPGAAQDMERLANLINNFPEPIHRIIVTVDTHQMWHIGHPCWWMDRDGLPPSPFTELSLKKDFDEVDPYRFVSKENVYRPVENLSLNWATYYLSKTGKHIVWPPHCLIGTPGHNIVSCISDAIFAWQNKTKKAADYLIKGSDENIEQFSAFDQIKHSSALCGICTPPHTHVNNIFCSVKKIYVGGEALSHCVSRTVSDIVRQNPDLLSHIVLLKDACSPVPNYEEDAERFLNEMTAKGMNVALTEDFLK